MYHLEIFSGRISYLAVITAIFSNFYSVSPDIRMVNAILYCIFSTCQSIVYIISYYDNNGSIDLKTLSCRQKILHWNYKYYSILFFSLTGMILFIIFYSNTENHINLLVGTAFLLVLSALLRLLHGSYEELMLNKFPFHNKNRTI